MRRVAEMNNRIALILGDITEMKVDAIVNAANSSLLGGGGVDGAIHQRAGPKLLEECRLLGGCPTGEARITKAYALPCKYVIHTVGPIWTGGKHGEDQLLRNCYRNSLQLAAKHDVKTIAFPSISTGAYRFPIERAARIAINTTSECLTNMNEIEVVIFVSFSQTDYEVYARERKLEGRIYRSSYGVDYASEGMDNSKFLLSSFLKVLVI
jgi:O-acetyl-ADP-ribose deacetylase (regulator of RNase III)